MFRDPHYNRRGIVALCGSMLFAALIASCGLFGHRGLALPPTPSILDDPGWLVVKEAYATLKERPGLDARDAGHLRDGLLLQIRGRAFGVGKEDNLSILWYLVSSDEGSGWLSSADCDVFASKEQALRSLGQGPQR